MRVDRDPARRGRSEDNLRLTPVAVGLVGQFDQLGEVREVGGEPADPVVELGRVEIAGDEVLLVAGALGVVRRDRQPLVHLHRGHVTGRAGDAHILGAGGDQRGASVVEVDTGVDEAGDRLRAAGAHGRTRSAVTFDGEGVGLILALRPLGLHGEHLAGAGGVVVGTDDFDVGGGQGVESLVVGLVRGDGALAFGETVL
jgi:hypothetical protein